MNKVDFDEAFEKGGLYGESMFKACIKNFTTNIMYRHIGFFMS